MNKTTLIDKLNIKYYKDKSFLDRQNYLLELLFTLDNNLLEYGINILNLYKEDNTAYKALILLSKYKNRETIECLTNINTINNNIAIEGTYLLNEGKNNFNRVNACDVICNKSSIEGGIALESVKLINKSENWFNAYYARYPLTSKVAIDKNYALEGANVINNSDKLYKAQLLSIITCNEHFIDNGMSTNIGNEINNTNSWDSAYKMLYEYVKNNAIYIGDDHLYKDNTYSLMGSRLIRTMHIK